MNPSLKSTHLVTLWHLVEELSDLDWLPPPPLLHGPEVLDVDGPIVAVVRVVDLNQMVLQMSEDPGPAPLIINQDEDPVTRTDSLQSSSSLGINCQFLFQILEGDLQ